MRQPFAWLLLLAALVVPASAAPSAPLLAVLEFDSPDGSAKLDEGAVADVLVSLSKLAARLGDRLESIDVNPFVALEKGAVALDGLVVLRG